MSQDDLVSITLCAYNSENTIREAVESLLRQSYRSFELFVVDDGSTDRTSLVVERHISDPRVTLIKLERNVGTYMAKNLVLKFFAKGRYYAHQDSDDISLCDRLAEQIAFLNARGVSACGVAIDEFYSDPEIQPRFSTDSEARFCEKDHCYHKTNFYPEAVSVQDVFATPQPVENLKIAMNGSLLFDMRVIRDLGAFDAGMPVGADTHLLLRLIALHPFGNVQKVLYSRRFHASSLTASKETGFGSLIRRKVIRQIEEERRLIWRHLERGESAEARKLVVRTLVVPKVRFTSARLARPSGI